MKASCLWFCLTLFIFLAPWQAVANAANATPSFANQHYEFQKNCNDKHVKKQHLGIIKAPASPSHQQDCNNCQSNRVIQSFELAPYTFDNLANDFINIYQYIPPTNNENIRVTVWPINSQSLTSSSLILQRSKKQLYLVLLYPPLYNNNLPEAIKY